MHTHTIKCIDSFKNQLHTYPHHHPPPLPSLSSYVYRCDSGLTLATVRDRVLAAGAATVTSAVLLDKKARRKVEFVPDYVGYDCPNQWVAGVGMDTNQLFRGLDQVVVLKEAAIKSALADNGSRGVGNGNPADN